MSITLSWNTNNVVASNQDTTLTSQGLGSLYSNNAAAVLTSDGSPCYVKFKFNSTYGFNYFGLTQSVDVTQDYSEYDTANIFGFKKDEMAVYPVINGEINRGITIDSLTTEYTILYDGSNIFLIRENNIVVTRISPNFILGQPIYVASLSYGSYLTSITDILASTDISEIQVQDITPRNLVPTYSNGLLTITFDVPTSSPDKYVLSNSNGDFLTVTSADWVDLNNKRTISTTKILTDANITITPYKSEIPGELVNITITPYPLDITVQSANYAGNTISIILDKSGQVFNNYSVKDRTQNPIFTTQGLTIDVETDTISFSYTGTNVQSLTGGLYVYGLDSNNIEYSSSVFIVPNNIGNFTGTIIPLRKDNLEWYLNVGTLTIGGIEISQNAYVTIVDSNVSPVTSFVYNGADTYTISALIVSENYSLLYNDKALSFTTNESFIPTVNVDSIAETSVDIIIRPPLNSSILYKSNNEDITSLLDNITLSLYDQSDTLIESKSLDGSTSYTFSLTGLTAGSTYSGYYVILSGSTNLTGFSSYTYTGSSTGTVAEFTTLGGGGGGGGGGNNGGNGYNNMATLELNYTGYIGDVTQMNTITILGEQGGALTNDHEIVVNVPLADFKKVLQYSSNWNSTGDAEGEQPRPKVLFRPLEVHSQLTTMFDNLNTLGSGAAGSSGRKFTDDAGNSIPVFGDVLLGVEFTNSALDSENLPRESIRKIEEGAITATALASADGTDCVLKNLSTEPDTAGGSPPLHKELLEGLFEQAVSANRVTKLDNNTGAQQNYKCPSFIMGDKISFLVTYNFSKERDYVLDNEVTGGNTTTGARTTFLVDGTTFDIEGANETATDSKTYMITLNATA